MLALDFPARGERNAKSVTGLTGHGGGLREGSLTTGRIPRRVGESEGVEVEGEDDDEGERAQDGADLEG